MAIVVVVVPADERRNLMGHLETYIDEHVLDGRRRILGFGINASGRRPYDALVVVDQAWWEDAAHIRSN